MEVQIQKIIKLSVFQLPEATLTFGFSVGVLACLPFQKNAIDFGIGWGKDPDIGINNDNRMLQRMFHRFLCFCLFGSKIPHFKGVWHEFLFSQYSRAFCYHTIIFIQIHQTKFYMVFQPILSIFTKSFFSGAKIFWASSKVKMLHFNLRRGPNNFLGKNRKKCSLFSGPIHVVQLP